MEAGRALDALIAERFLGYRWRMPAAGPRAGWVTFKALLPADANDQRPIVASDDPRLAECVDGTRVPPFSADAALAMQLVREHMATPGFRVEVTMQGGCDCTLRWWNDEDCLAEVDAPTFALAVCRALLDNALVENADASRPDDGGMGA